MQSKHCPFLMNYIEKNKNKNAYATSFLKERLVAFLWKWNRNKSQLIILTKNEIVNKKVFTIFGNNEILLG